MKRLLLLAILFASPLSAQDDFTRGLMAGEESAKANIPTNGWTLSTLAIGATGFLWGDELPKVGVVLAWTAGVGILTTAVKYAVASNGNDPSPETLAGFTGGTDSFYDGFSRGYEAYRKSRRRTDALISGVVGTALFGAVLLIRNDYKEDLVFLSGNDDSRAVWVVPLFSFRF